MSSTTNITKEQEAYIITLIENGGFLKEEDLQYRDVFRAVGFVVTHDNGEFYLTGMTHIQSGILTKYRISALHKKMLMKGHDVPLDVVAALVKQSHTKVHPVLFQLGVIFTNDTLLKHFLRNPLFLHGSVSESSTCDYEDWLQRTMSVATIYQFQTILKAHDLKLIETAIDKVHTQLKGVIDFVKYEKPKDYIRYNQPKLRLGNLCIKEILDYGKDFTEEAEWVLKQHLKLEDCKFPYLLCSKKKREINEPDEVVVLQKYTTAGEALSECKKHSGRLIVMINFKRNKLGWFELHERITSGKYVYIGSEDRLTTHKG
jgi:hypothetical protein